MKVVSKFTADKLNCIPENIGKYKAMDVGQLQFLDSFQHMGMGLDKLVECLGYTLEVDLEVPVHLHDFFADYPLAPEKQLVPEEWLSLYNERLVHDKEVGDGKYTTGEKLVQTLYPKKNYVVHYRVLQLYMNLGMKVTKIHSALKFKQSPWMKEYIEENIRKRKIAKANGDEFGVIYYKLKNNAVFGKQMENVRKHMRVELLRTDEDKKIRRLASSPLFVGFKQFDGGITADETKGNPIGESVCLKPKMYSILLARHDPKTPETDADYEKELEEEQYRKSQGEKKWEKKHGIQKAKGVKKCVVKRELRHDKFLEWLNPYDNKRWILLDGIRTLPYGHWRIRLYKRLIASEISSEEAEERAMKAKLRVKT
ncbi:6381_t:CDS:2 [Funneliformis mosseae]|uniref:6381_t:CDS:1 n=1 Tax=Funneliformis mosseae TaxID=27381 RepID=A0A9N9N709_FUNMO|nr:6381_t:CDS:2 [Funneliformis mosseae]